MHNQTIKTPPWKSILRQNFTNIEKLADFLELDQEKRKELLLRCDFQLNLPLRLAKKIPKNDIQDPLFLQFIPLKKESVQTPGFVPDPVEEFRYRKASKLLHKYEGRALLVTTSACAMHCRYCFRRNFNYALSEKGFEEEFELIKEDSSIKEVILSGGDPLSLSDETLKYILDQLTAIPHVTRIRFHTRFPIGIPERIDSDFEAILRSTKKQIWFVIHSNHPRELDDDVIAALKRVQSCNCTVVNQSVLSKGVNDDPAVLKELCERLVDNGIQPYYLHQLDRVKGAGHFEVTEEEGKKLIEEISKSLPGYAVPRYVREISGQPSKITIL